MLKIASFLLLFLGVIHAVPSMEAYLLDMVGGSPILEIIIGVAAVMVGFGLMIQSQPMVKGNP